MKRSLLVLAALAASALVAGFAHADVYDVQIQNFAFNPSTLTIAPGDSVRWTNLDAIPHTSTSGVDCTSDGLWDSGTLNQGDTFVWVASGAGDYYYFCSLHCPMMEGEIEVEAETATESTTWGQVRAIYR
ncbi:MAG: plastocyanin/azurin family copper-binding protein [Candidatus Eisenbacteria bacterium]